MENKILEIKNQALDEINKASDLKSLDEVKNKFLSRNSQFNNLKKGLKDIEPSKRPKIGALLNQISSELSKLIEEKNDIFYKKELSEKLLKEKIDITLDGNYIP